MAEAYLETTEWADIRGCNHTYYLEGSKMLAYVRSGTTEPYWFKRPIDIDRRGRKFQRVDDSIFKNSMGGLIIFAQPEPSGPELVEVQGSKPGSVYYVNVKEQSCTCPGYTFRGTCKHTKELLEALC